MQCIKLTVVSRRTCIHSHNLTLPPSHLRIHIPSASYSMLSATMPQSLTLPVFNQADVAQFYQQMLFSMGVPMIYDQQPSVVVPVPALSAQPSLSLSAHSSPSPMVKEEPSERVSPSSSTQSIPRVRRGRPQQQIEDKDDDPNSLKRKHRRLYARQYRAQMRQRVDEVKVLQEELEQLKRSSEEKISRLANEVRLKDELINRLLVNKQLLPTAF